MRGRQVPALDGSLPRAARLNAKPLGVFTTMPTLHDVYRKFGEVSEGAQLLETELGTLLLQSLAREHALFDGQNSKQARVILDRINKATLGRLLRELTGEHPNLDSNAALLSRALDERNRLAHNFYRQHNFRRNSDEGRALMLQDLETMHTVIIDAYKLVMRLSGVDLDTLEVPELPTQHLPLE